MPALKDPKHEKFAQEYVVDFNGAQAAIRAGYAKRSARVTASRMLSKANIMSRVKELTAREVAKVEMNPDRIVKELSILGTVDISQAFDEEGNLRPIHDIPESVRRAIAGFEVVEEIGPDGHPTGTFTKKLKFWDKNTSLLGLAKVFKMLVDRSEVKSQITMENFMDGTWPDKEEKK